MSDTQNSGDILEELKWRGLVEQVTDEEGLKKLLGGEPASIYCGFDPSAKSLQVGNMIPLLTLRRLQKAGHKPIVLVGGATGMIGDPSGKSEERNLLTEDDLKRNVEAFRGQLSRFVDFEGPAAARMVNNLDWIGPLTFIGWLRDVGKHFSVNYMMAKESVRARIENREQGISYTEFSYMMLQAYDFYHLNKEMDCCLQIGGNDQWGNITAGIELIRKQTGKSAYGMTQPLVLTASGEKLGKTAGNAIWLDPELTSPFAFYQYWVRTDDRDVIQFIRNFTDLDKEEIEALAKEVEEEPHKRSAQKKLAEWMTTLVHGTEGLESSVKATQVLYGGAVENLNDRQLAEIFADVPSHAIKKDRLADGIRLQDLLVESGFLASKGDAKRRIQAGGIYINNAKVTDRDKKLTEADLASESSIVLRKGKKDYLLLRME